MRYDAVIAGARCAGAATALLIARAGGRVLVLDFKDPLTAHGITDALRDAELLARAAIRGTSDAFAEYETVRLDLSSRLFDITDEIASFAWTDAEVQTLHRALSAEMAREVRTLVELEPMPTLARV